MRKVATGAAAIAALACAGSAPAHHSISMIDVSVPVWVKGTVVRYEPINPHAMFELEETTDDGQRRRWTIEGPFPGRLDRILSLNRMGADEPFLNAGDVIEVCGFYPKGESAPSRRYIHGHVLVMPDGRMQSWGPTERPATVFARTIRPRHGRASSTRTRWPETSGAAASPMQGRMR